MENKKVGCKNSTFFDVMNTFLSWHNVCHEHVWKRLLILIKICLEEQEILSFE